MDNDSSRSKEGHLASLLHTDISIQPTSPVTLKYCLAQNQLAVRNRLCIRINSDHQPPARSIPNQATVSGGPSGGNGVSRCRGSLLRSNQVRACVNAIVPRFLLCLAHDRVGLDGGCRLDIVREGTGDVWRIRGCVPIEMEMGMDSVQNSLVRLGPSNPHFVIPWNRVVSRCGLCYVNE